MPSQQEDWHDRVHDCCKLCYKIRVPSLPIAGYITVVLIAEEGVRGRKYNSIPNAGGRRKKRLTLPQVLPCSQCCWRLCCPQRSSIAVCEVPAYGHFEIIGQGGQSRPRVLLCRRLFKLLFTQVHMITSRALTRCRQQLVLIELQRNAVIKEHGKQGDRT